DTFLMLQPWPEVDEAMVVPGLCEAMELLQAVVSGIRQVRNEMGLPDREQLAVLIEPQADEQLAARIEAALPFLADRANASVRIADLASVTTRGLTAVVGTISMRVEFTGEQEELLTGYRARLEKQLAAKQKAAKGKQARLDNPGYVNKAPAAKVQETRDLLAADEAEIAKLQATIAGL
ncbi:MAG: class I tRNA ligase family protein, partial [Planctomycetota bacterium]